MATSVGGNVVPDGSGGCRMERREETESDVGSGMAAATVSAGT